MHTNNDLNRLREALLQVDTSTQQFIQPLLYLECVQTLLLSILNSPDGRTLQEWIWDPMIRSRLEILREQTSNDIKKDLDHWFHCAAKDNIKQDILSSSPVLKEMDLHTTLEQSQVDGRTKFQMKLYYGAKNAYITALNCLKQIQETNNKSIERIQDWENEMQERYVTLCSNIAMCALKLQDYLTTRTYALMALQVNNKHLKAFYSLAKAYYHTLDYDHAKEILIQAQEEYPENQQFQTLFQAVNLAIEKQEKEQQIMKEQFQALQLQKNENKAKEDEFRVQYEQELLKQRQEAYITTPLPELISPLNDDQASSRLYGYFTKIKHHLDIQIVTRFESEKGEEPKFECAIWDDTKKKELASSIFAPSKKLVKNEACKVAIHTLWKEKREANELSPQQLEKLKDFEQLLEQKDSTTVKKPEKKIESSNTIVDYSPFLAQIPVRVYHTERQRQPTMVLNQLAAQKKIHIAYLMEDLSPPSQLTTDFKCTCILNGVEMATCNAESKKRAKFLASEETIKKAIAKNWFLVHENEYEDEEEDNSFEP